MAIKRGTSMSEQIDGTDEADELYGDAGDDILVGGAGNDALLGENGNDVLFGGAGNDRLAGGRGIDNLFGGIGNDVLFGDAGPRQAKGTDLSSDALSGGDGNDVLNQGDGNDVLSGGAGSDTFAFRWQDPMVAAAAGTARAFAEITDFNAADDRMTFDVAGVGNVNYVGANFVDGGAGAGTAGGVAASFFGGDAAQSNGEAVMVLTGQGYASGVEAITAAQGEATGDLVLYFNTTVGVASLLYTDGTDAAHSIARFSNIDSLSDLQNAGFTASDFVFV